MISRISLRSKRAAETNGIYERSVKVRDCSVGRSIWDRWLFSSWVNIDSVVTSFVMSPCNAWYAPRKSIVMIEILITIFPHFARLSAMMGIWNWARELLNAKRKSHHKIAPMMSIFEAFFACDRTKGWARFGFEWAKRKIGPSKK